MHASALNYVALEYAPFDSKITVVLENYQYSHIKISKFNLPQRMFRHAVILWYPENAISTYVFLCTLQYRI